MQATACIYVHGDPDSSPHITIWPVSTWLAAAEVALIQRFTGEEQKVIAKALATFQHPREDGPSCSTPAIRWYKVRAQTGSRDHAREGVADGRRWLQWQCLYRYLYFSGPMT